VQLKKKKKKRRKVAPLPSMLSSKTLKPPSQWVGIKIVAITLISLLEDQGHNNSNYLQFPIPAIILL